MAQSPPDGMTRIIPYLLYSDAGAALEWLAEAFGFRERMRHADPDGRVSHAEMEFDGGVIMLGEPGEGYRNPAALGQPTVLLYVDVDDVDAHCERARRAGAVIGCEPADQEYGDRNYQADDPEGHRWFFAQRVRDVPPEEWGAEIPAE